MFAHVRTSAGFETGSVDCPVFNDGAFSPITDKETKDLGQIRLQPGGAIRFGARGKRGVVRSADGCLEVADVAAVGDDALLRPDPARAHPGPAFSLAKLAEIPTGPRRSACSATSSGRCIASGGAEPATEDQLAS